MGRVVRVRRRQTEEVRGWAVDVMATIRRCGACLDEWENTADPDWRPSAYVSYSLFRGWPTAALLAHWRFQRRLSAADVDDNMGWPPGRMASYEGGRLPSEEDGPRLKLLMSA